MKQKGSAVKAEVLILGNRGFPFPAQSARKRGSVAYIHHAGLGYGAAEAFLPYLNPRDPFSFLETKAGCLNSRGFNHV